MKALNLFFSQHSAIPQFLHLLVNSFCEIFGKGITKLINAENG